MANKDNRLSARLRDAAASKTDATQEPVGEDRIQSVEERQEKLRDILNSVLLGEVVPRVFDANGGTQGLKDQVDRRGLDQFRHCVLEGSHDMCVEFVQDRIDAGESLRAVCMGLFTVTARELGEAWSADELSFVEVTIGLGRLHKLVHHFSAVDSSLRSPKKRHNIILASAVADQHVFGVLLVSKIFEMEGWLVSGGPDLHTGADLTTLVQQSWFDIVGLSASTPEMARSLQPEIKKLRSASLNPGVFVIVGGAGFSGDADLAQTIGADQVAGDADDAILKARALLMARKAKAAD